MQRDYRLFIEGQWQNAPSAATFQDVNPATGEVFARVADADAAITRRAVEAAKGAAARWGDLAPAARDGIMLKAAQAWERRQGSHRRLHRTAVGEPAERAPVLPVRQPTLV